MAPISQKVRLQTIRNMALEFGLDEIGVFHPSKDAAVPPSLDFLSMGGQIRIPTRVPLHILLSGIVRAEERKPKAI